MKIWYYISSLALLTNAQELPPDEATETPKCLIEDRMKIDEDGNCSKCPEFTFPSDDQKTCVGAKCDGDSEI